MKKLFSSFGPAPFTLLAAILIVGIAAFGALVPIGFQAQTLSFEEAAAMLAGAAALAAWSAVVGINARRLSRIEDGAAILVWPLSPGVFDLLFTAPLVVSIPCAAGILPALLHGGPAEASAVFGLLISVGTLALRETDATVYVRDGRVCVRRGWLFVRRAAVSASQVTKVYVERDSYQGAPSYVVKFVLADTGIAPRFECAQARLRSEEQAHAEAQRWRTAMETS